MESISSEDINRTLLISIRKIISAADRHSRRLIKIYGLTIPQLLVLQEVMVSGGCTISRLTGAISLSQPTVTDIVERLSKRGFLKRSPSGTDRRSNIITITDEGITLLSKQPSLFPAPFLDALHNLQDWEQTLMLSTLQRMARMMSSDSDSSSIILTDC